MTDTLVTPETQPAKAAILKSHTRKIRSTIMANLASRTAGMDYAGIEASLKALTLDEFKAMVLAVDPEWPIAQKAGTLDEKEGHALVSSHRSWYISNFKKSPEVAALKPAEAPVAQTIAA